MDDTCTLVGSILRSERRHQFELCRCFVFFEDEQLSSGSCKCHWNHQSRRTDASFRLFINWQMSHTFSVPNCCLCIGIYTYSVVVKKKIPFVEMVTLTLVLDFEDLRIQPWLDGWPLKRIEYHAFEWYDCYCNYYFAFLRRMNLLTEKHWTLSENTMRPWRIHWRSLTGMCLNWVQSFYHRPARHARGVMPTGHGGYLLHSEQWSNDLTGLSASLLETIQQTPRGYFPST
jgi:hypothetical protein